MIIEKMNFSIDFFMPCSISVCVCLCLNFILDELKGTVCWLGIVVVILMEEEFQKIVFLQFDRLMQPESFWDPSLKVLFRCIVWFKISVSVSLITVMSWSFFLSYRQYPVSSCLYRDISISSFQTMICMAPLTLN